MLILSRKDGESIVFPVLGISIHVKHLRARSVTLGIEAPKGIRILRSELKLREEDKVMALQATATDHLGHKTRNRLNAISLALHAISMQLQNGLTVDPSLVTAAIEELRLLDESPESSAATVGRGDKVTGGNPFALLIEDNENESTLLEGFLRQAGFRVATALDGEAALSFLRVEEKLPQIILMDMNMPGMNGPATIREIRNDPVMRELKVFAVSGSTPTEQNVTVGDDGVNRWFRKPIRPEELLAEIRATLT